MEQQPQTAPPVFLEPPPPPPTPQKTVGEGFPRVPPLPDKPRIGLFHGLQWCFLVPIAINTIMSIITSLVVSSVIPLVVSLIPLFLPIVGHKIECRFPVDSPKRLKIAEIILSYELFFFIVWEVGITIWLWPRGV
ncbi:MAG: hypothetical protein RBG13Loki_3180 [Promethearchaeota archaeon CR_4]|nr:MAG: hypothetical protein RBG13Loki_3180 [Candidatus Lokiarchaeota archaeon CR_4]